MTLYQCHGNKYAANDHVHDTYTYTQNVGMTSSSKNETAAVALFNPAFPTPSPFTYTSATPHSGFANQGNHHHHK